MGADVTRCVELAIYIVDRNIFFADLYADRFFGATSPFAATRCQLSSLTFFSLSRDT